LVRPCFYAQRISARHFYPKCLNHFPQRTFDRFQYASRIYCGTGYKSRFIYDFSAFCDFLDSLFSAGRGRALEKNAKIHEYSLYFLHYLVIQNMQDKITIGGIIESRNLIMISILSAPNQPGIAGKILTYLGNQTINVEFITESGNASGGADISFCIHSDFRAQILNHLDELKNLVQAQISKWIDNVAILTIYGPHFREKPAVAGRMCAALGSFGINILGISTSISSVSCVIDNAKIELAKTALMQFFQLPE